MDDGRLGRGRGGDADGAGGGGRRVASLPVAGLPQTGPKLPVVDLGNGKRGSAHLRVSHQDQVQSDQNGQAPPHGGDHCAGQTRKGEKVGSGRDECDSEREERGGEETRDHGELPRDVRRESAEDRVPAVGDRVPDRLEPVPDRFGTLAGSVPQSLVILEEGVDEAVREE